MKRGLFFVNFFISLYLLYAWLNNIGGFGTFTMFGWIITMGNMAYIVLTAKTSKPDETDDGDDENEQDLQEKKKIPMVKRPEEMNQPRDDE
jgi:hypothetical protein